ncbi:MAG: 3-oxoacyl-[acyl-carrier-protein] synthase III C-terminal domain-containing protein [Candidatus Bathyarchaeota archaeon]|jgi:predicted naringenin-chalcone synthase|nr:3-oxoacyl-[acyl-carrier-protein] synthase III C-terminal domain-containing protein [Candidatus Bathyarchaeota archaeon]
MKILKMAAALPEKQFTTEKLMESFPCRLPEGLRQNILNLGVSKRYLLNHSNLNSMSEAKLIKLCEEACTAAVKKAGLSIADINYFIAAYDANPFLSPGLSQLLLPALRLDPYTGLVNLQGIASTAFPKTLEIAGGYLASHPEDNVLICVSGVSSYWFQNQVRGLAEVMDISEISSIADQARRQRELQKWMATIKAFLFGDGVASAVVANEGGGLHVVRTAEVTNIEKRDYLAGHARLVAADGPFKFGFYTHLGKEIPELGAKYTTLVLKRLFGDDYENMLRDVKKWAVHTGSVKILNALSERHGIEAEKLQESYEVLREYGNLAGASLPFIVERIISKGKLSDGDLVLMLGYGWGFSASASLLRLEK